MGTWVGKCECRWVDRWDASLCARVCLHVFVMLVIVVVSSLRVLKDTLESFQVSGGLESIA